MTRRRFIAITAALSGAAVVPRQAWSMGPQTYSWQGIALGAEASLTLEHYDEAEAKSAIAACLAEVARLEAIFSLHRPNSALSRLNTGGRLDGAPADLRVLLAEALSLAARSNGAFDPTVQPLWALYARHFATPGASSDGPADRDINTARDLIGWHRVTMADATIRLEPGMALTLNGIAQGYITDKIGDLLSSRGFEHVLVNMGEQLALGPKWSGSAWQVGIADPAAPEQMLAQVTLSSGAIATSGGYGCRFDEAGRFTHILDPRTGSSARQLASATVVAARATEADGLSTVLTVVPPSATAALLASAARAYVVPFGAGIGHWL